MRNRLQLLSVALLGLLLAGCGSTKIGRVLADPARYNNRNVTVEGRVTQSVGAFIAGVYQVEDETGKIYVLSSRGVPSKGVRVKVEGTVTPGLSLMGKSIGTTIRERDHKVRF
jgi:hypothetical protein